jgi:hypothetical protein
VTRPPFVGIELRSLGVLLTAGLACHLRRPRVVVKVVGNENE